MGSDLFSLRVRVFFTGVCSSSTKCELAVKKVGPNALQRGGLRENPEKCGALVIGFFVMMRSQVT